MKQSAKTSIGLYIWFILFILVFVILGVLRQCSDNYFQTIDDTFIREFNEAVGPNLSQASRSDINAIARGCKFNDPEDAAIVWLFAEKYGINEFPLYTNYAKYGTLSDSSQAKAVALATHLKAVDEYIEENGIDREDAARLIRQAYAVQSGDLLELLSAYRSN